MGQLTLSMGRGGGGRSFHLRTKRYFQVRGLIVYTLKYFKNTKHAIIKIMCLVQNVNIFSLMQVKNKLRDREMEHAFILGSMDSPVANSGNIGCIPPMS